MFLYLLLSRREMQNLRRLCVTWNNWESDFASKEEVGSYFESLPHFRGAIFVNFVPDPSWQYRYHMLFVYNMFTFTSLKDVPVVAPPSGGIDWDNVQVCTGFGSCITNWWDSFPTLKPPAVLPPPVYEPPVLEDPPTIVPIESSPPPAPPADPVADWSWLKWIGELIEWGVGEFVGTASDLAQTGVDFLKWFVRTTFKFGTSTTEQALDAGKWLVESSTDVAVHITDSSMDVVKWAFKLLVPIDYDWSSFSYSITSAFDGAPLRLGFEGFTNSLSTIFSSLESKEGKCGPIVSMSGPSEIFDGFEINSCSSDINWDRYRGILSFFVYITGGIASWMIIYRMVTLSRKPEGNISGGTDS